MTILLSVLAFTPVFAEEKPAAVRFIKELVYAGPTQSVHAEGEARDGKPIYADRDYRFADLPAELNGADYVQTSNSDKYYNSAALLQITVKAGTVVSVAHDDRVDRPEWLMSQFQPKDLTVLVEGRPMKVFQHRAEVEEIVKLGANVKIPDGKSCHMYLVFVNTALVK